MKKINLRSICMAVFLLTNAAAAAESCCKPDQVTPSSVIALTQKVADWQIDTFEESDKYRGMSMQMRERQSKQGEPIPRWHDLAWHNAALYAGMNQWRKVAPNGKKYTDWLISIGDKNEWKLWDRPYHADDHAVGMTFLDLYRDTGKKEMMLPTQAHFDWILDNPKTGSIEWKKGTDRKKRWGWCDALFMAPPVWARLAAITGEPKYLDFMDKEYHFTYDYLWDKEESLFWRDSSFFGQTEANGKKLFWARGNGWVFGGLALMIPDLPKDWEGRQFYIDLYKAMAKSIVKVQRDDGYWNMGLLGDKKAYSNPESSGTAFFTFGLAWGINNGYLDSETYTPVVMKAWHALTQVVTDDGMLVYVQPVGAAPGESFADKSEVYGVGAFLAAGSEVYKLIQSK